MKASPSPLKGLSALVTGASRGIGKAIALRLASHGVKLALSGRNPKTLEAVVQECLSLGTQAKGFPADLERLEPCTALIQSCMNCHGGLDILINNAGLAANCPIEETSPELFDRLMAVNAKAPFFLCQAALPHLKRSLRATILNISSVVGHKGYENQAAYTASKHALLGLTKVLAQEAQPHGIRVHALCPGGVATDMVREMRPDLDESALILPDEIAETVEFLLLFRGRAAVDRIDIRRAGGRPFA